MLSSCEFILLPSQAALAVKEEGKCKESFLDCQSLDYQLVDKQELFTQWMTEHEKLLRHIITGFEAKVAIQDELFQEIALNIWRALPQFRHGLGGENLCCAYCS